MMIERRNRWAKSVRVGCFSPLGQTFFDGTIAEILVFNRPLSGAEKAAVMAYLAAKWDLEWGERALGRAPAGEPVVMRPVTAPRARGSAP